MPDRNCNRQVHLERDRTPRVSPASRPIRRHHLADRVGSRLAGAIGFAALALAIAARDKWIGWPSEVRRVLGLSRFLIRRPPVKCRLPASKVLGMALRQLPDDFSRRCGCRPALLETFVNAGTCFRAGNWICVGETAGQHLPVKRVFVNALLREPRSVPGAEATPVLQPSGLAAGLALDQFAEIELEEARWVTYARLGEWPKPRGCRLQLPRPRSQQRRRATERRSRATVASSTVSRDGR